MSRKHLFYAALPLLLLSSCAPKHYQLTGIERTRIIVDSRYDNQPDQAAADFMAPYKRVNDSIMAPLMGRVAHNMHATRPESDLSNLLSDILIWASKDYNESPVLAVYNMGGIRADLTKGDVTYEDLLSIAPFENKICFVTLSGEQLMQVRASARAANWSSPRLTSAANSSLPVCTARRSTLRPTIVSSPSTICSKATTDSTPSP